MRVLKALITAGVVTATVGVGSVMQAADATYPGTNGRVAFDSAEEILTINPDGTGQLNLTNHTAIDSSPSWTVDGNQILFDSNRDADYDIYMMESNGTNVVNLTENSTGTDRYPVPTPDGNQFVFVSSRSGNSEIFVANINGTSPIDLTNNVGQDSFPALSPDGSKIVFASNRDGNSEIYVMNFDGTNQVNVTNNAALDTEPAWSPDGSKIVFSSTQGAGDREIYTMNADGTNVVNISNHTVFDSGPTYSPDGTKIAFSSNRSGTKQIAVVNLDGSDVVRLTNNPAVDDNNPDWQPCPSGGCDFTPIPTTTTLTVDVTKKKVKANGIVSPPQPGAEISVILYKKKNGVFKKVDEINPVLTEESAYDVSFTKPKATKCKVTTTYPGDEFHESSSKSSKFSC